MSSASFERKVDQLSAAINEGSRRISIKDQCFPTAIAMGTTVPFATMLILFLTKPFFVKRYEGNKSTIDIKKLFWTTFFATITIWAGMYVFNKYRGFDKLTMTCVV